MKPRPERADRKQSGCGVGLAGGLVLLLPVLYLASTGPAIWLRDHSYISQETINVVYAPLIWAGLHSPMIEEAITWYCDWWQ